MAKTDNLTDFLTDLADGIRKVRGTTAKINPQDFRSQIEAIGNQIDSAYNNGYDEGYSEGYADGFYDGQTEGLEALGELCQWQVMIDSEGFYTVMVSNMHPSYTLHCDVIYGEEYYMMVIPPNSLREYVTDGAAHQESPVQVDNMRWKSR